MIFGYITGALTIAILIIRFIPFIPLEVKIEWITYLGIPLIILVGGGALAFIRNIFIALIMGAVAFAFFQALIQTL